MFFLASKSDDDGLKLIFGLIAFGGLGIYRGFRAFQHRRKTEDTARSAIASAPQGYVEVQGQAWPTADLQGLDGRPVCYWSFTIEECQGSGKNSRWVKVFSLITEDEILVTDASGTCRVRPSNAEIAFRDQVLNRKELTEENLRVINARAPGAVRYVQGGVFSNQIKITELKLLAGAPVYVRGEFATTSEQTHAVAVGDHHSFRQQMTKLNSPGYQASMFDRDKNGSISEEEARSGYAAAANPFLRNKKYESVAVTGFFETTEQHKLFIADAHERHLVARLANQAVFSLWGGAAMFAAGVYLLAQKMGWVS